MKFPKKNDFFLTKTLVLMTITSFIHVIHMNPVFKISFFLKNPTFLNEILKNGQNTRIAKNTPKKAKIG